ncbi:hypothetical protein [Campylobacter sp.]|uniref:hypothetical protein n=1 Tax=Campylobacter sp. TaxID=205 RepID=UPI003FA13F5C
MTAIVRNKEYKNSSVKVFYKDIFELTKADLVGFDAVISAFGTFTDVTFPLYKKVAIHLINLLSGSSTRLIIIVSGAGTLLVDDKGTMAMDTPDFPHEYMGVARAAAESFFEPKTNRTYFGCM